MLLCIVLCLLVVLTGPVTSVWEPIITFLLFSVPIGLSASVVLAQATRQAWLYIPFIVYNVCLHPSILD